MHPFCIFFHHFCIVVVVADDVTFVYITQTLYVAVLRSKVVFGDYIFVVIVVL